MQTKLQSIQDWQALGKFDPALLIERFNQKLDALSLDTRDSLISSQYDQIQLVGKLSEQIAREDAPLAGVPFLLQDMIDAPGLPTACGAPFRAPFEMEVDTETTLVNVLESLGAFLLAKTVPAEFGVDPRGRNRSYGDCQHPSDVDLICGGGAGSCVSAVRQGLAPLAFGLDTVGGVRIPCAFQGAFGYRMGLNAFTQEGVFPIMPSIESIGFTTNCLEDLAMCYKAIFPQRSEYSKKIPRGFFIDDPGGCRMSPAVKGGMLRLSRELDIYEDYTRHIELNRAFASGGASLQLLQARELYTIHQYWIDEYREQYDTSLLRRIYRGMECSTSEVEKACATQDQIRLILAEFFEDYDFLLMPISTTPSPNKQDWSIDLETDLNQINAPLSLSMLPAIILPFECDGYTSAAQIIVNPHRPDVVPNLIAQFAEFYADQAQVQ